MILYSSFLPQLLFFRQGIVCTIHCALLYFLWREDARKGANLVNKVKFWNFHTLPRPLGMLRHWIRIKTLLQEIYKLIFQTYEKWKPALIISGRKSNRKRVKGKLKHKLALKLIIKLQFWGKICLKCLNALFRSVSIPLNFSHETLFISNFKESKWLQAF